MIHHELFLITDGPCEGLHSSKLNWANWIIKKYRKLRIRVFFARFIQIKLQQLFTGKETTVLKSLPAAVVVSYFTASEKENLRTKRKRNYVIKNVKRKKNSDYYYLSNRKMIEVVFSSRVSLLPFYSYKKVSSAQDCSLACVSITVLWPKTRIKLVLCKLGKQVCACKKSTRNN